MCGIVDPWEKAEQAAGDNIPEARFARMSWTVIPVPQTMGLPLRTAGSMRKRSKYLILAWYRQGSVDQGRTDVQPNGRDSAAWPQSDHVGWKRLLGHICLTRERMAEQARHPLCKCLRSDSVGDARASVVESFTRIDSDHGPALLRANSNDWASRTAAACYST